MNEFNINPVNPHLVNRVSADRGQKQREQEAEQKKKKEKKLESEKTDNFSDNLEKTTEPSTSIEADSFSVGGEIPKPGYTMDWVRINNLKNSQSQ